MRQRVLTLLVVGTALAVAGVAAGQIQMPYSVVGSGGEKMMGAGNIMHGTVGQACIGVVSGPSNITEIGFWYRPGWILTGIDGEDVVPARFQLEQNHPNPFNPVTTIKFAVPERARVEVKVYDVAGREVTTLVNREMEPGFHTAVLDASGLPSGVYFARMVAGRYVETRKMVLLK
jgi:hypothetical protein